ncbi:MAG: hypothetical protein ACXW3P_09820, partial [Rhodospirillales bacterium]
PAVRRARPRSSPWSISFMMVKADVREPAIYAAILAILLGARLLVGRGATSGRASGRTVVRPRRAGPAVSG